MTEQLKAEAYVREQRPALMELTFGCEVIKSDMWQGTVVGEAYNQVAYLNTEKMQVFLAPAEQFEIIGHRPQLQDWLAVLGNYNREVRGKNHHWGIEVTDDAVIVGNNTITFNLTTGQPATEADYKAFNEFVSVCTKNTYQA